MHSKGSMHRVFHLVGNVTADVWQVVSEYCSGDGKAKPGQCSAMRLWGLAAGACVLLPASAFAGDLPSGGSIVAGSGVISRSGNALTVTQASARMAADWQTFSIGQANTVNFVQPSAAAVALNRVLGSDVSVIQGALNANGQVFLVNPNGVIFTPTAQVNVGALAASTLNVSTDDFLAGNYRFRGSSTASVSNAGDIRVGVGGTVALIAAHIENTGSISAPQGHVLMGAGQKVLLDMGGPVKIEVEEGALHALIAQGGAIRADGGLVYLSARAAGDLASSAINHTGITQARRLVTGERGEIYLMGDMTLGRVHVAGTLDTSSTGAGAGGFVETSAHSVQIADGTNIQAGHWLIDPTDFTVGVGTALATSSGIGAATLAAALTTGNVTIQTDASGGGNGDIVINGAVGWNAASKLTLFAHRNIDIHADITAEHASGQLQLEYGQGAIASGNDADYRLGGGAINLQAGDNFVTRLGSDGVALAWKVITSLGSAGSTTGVDLQGINGARGGNYVLGADIDASGSSSWNGYAGFAPIGDFGNAFTGRFDGLGHTIDGLSINRSSTDNIGLFGYTKNATLRNVGMTGGSIRGKERVGALVGWLDVGGGAASISNSYATSSTNGSHSVGALAGRNHGTISASHATASTYGGTFAGGLVGWNLAGGVIQGSYATGSLRGGNRLGGLVGINSGTVADSYSFVSITDVAAQNLFGGLVGENAGSITRSYAAGVVNVQIPSSNAGSLVGRNNGTISNSYWNSDTNSRFGLSGIAGGATTGATGLSGAQMQQSSNFTGFNFTTTPAIGNAWVIVNGDGSLNAAGAAGGGSTPMLASEFSTGIRNAHQLQLMAMDLGGSYAMVAHIDAAPTAGTGDVWGSAGFVSVGNSTLAFTGHFDGLGHTIAGLTINRPTADEVGLFGRAHNATLRNIGLLGGSVTGRDSVGGLVGYLDFGGGSASIGNSYSTSNVAGATRVGALAGFVTAASAGSVSISNSYAAGSVSGSGSAGALVGYLNAAGATASITSSFWDTQTTGKDANGGIGQQTGSITLTNTSGKTTAQMHKLSTFGSGDPAWDIAEDSTYAGSYLYPRLSIAGGSPVWKIKPPIRLLYTFDPLSGPSAYTGSAYDLADYWSAAELFGGGYGGWSLGTDYAFQYGGNTLTGFTDAGSYSGIGVDILKSGYAVATTGNTDGTFTITAAPLMVSAIDASKAYDAIAYSGGNGVDYTGFVSGQDASVLGGTLAYGGSSQGATDPGRYDITPQGVTSSNYTIDFVDGTLTIGERPIAPDPGNTGNSVETGSTGTADRTGTPDSTGNGNALVSAVATVQAAAMRGARPPAGFNLGSPNAPVLQNIGPTSGGLNLVETVGDGISGAATAGGTPQARLARPGFLTVFVERGGINTGNDRDKP